METGPTLHRAYRQLISIHCTEERQLAGEANSRIPYSCCDYEFSTPERYTTHAPRYMQTTDSLTVWRLVATRRVVTGIIRRACVGACVRVRGAFLPHSAVCLRAEADVKSDGQPTSPEVSAATAQDPPRLCEATNAMPRSKAAG